MNGSIDIPEQDLARGPKLKRGAIASPILLGGIPAILTIVLMVLFGASPPAAVTILFFGVIFSLIGLILGFGLTGYFVYQRNQWMKQIREQIAIDGIRAAEVDWFRSEMRASEKRMLDGLRQSNPLLGDAYAETLASRLTASRIIKSSRRELQAIQRRQSKLRQVNTDNSRQYGEELDSDIKRVNGVVNDAKVLLVETEGRLQMIETTAARGTVLAGNEQALKRLTAQAAQLPLALEEAKMADAIRRELEEEMVGE